MEYAVFSIVILLFIGIYFVSGVLSNKKREAWFRKKLKEQYGLLPDKEYKLEQFESISHYFHSREKSLDGVEKKGFVIDDITWNDLDMDSIFKAMNHTYSSAGEECLYDTLRRMQTKQSDLEQLEQLICFFMENEDARIEMQVEFSKLGKTGKYSLFDYIDYLEALGKRSNTKHYTVNLLIAAAVACIPLNAGMASIVLIGLIAYNIASYFKEKGEIIPYLTSFSYLLRLFHSSERIEKKRISQLQPYYDSLKKNRKKAGNFVKKSFWVMRSQKAVTAMDPLEIIMDYMRMLFHLDIIGFNTMLSEVRKHKQEIIALVETLGRMETAIAIGAFRASMSYYAIPQFTKDLVLNSVDAYHPLIENAVENTISIRQGVLLTGSNASGKSTFLKTIALNALLAQTIHTTAASSYEAGFFRLLTSMSLRDSIASGESYYMVEIRAIKRILDELEMNSIPVLCFVDEVLRGTNTVERIAASTQILKAMEHKNVICFAATHDIELTYLLEKEYKNYHFTEEISKGDVLFNYQLLEGRATSRNAIQLLQLMGFEESIIESASKRAARFLEEGKWEG